MEDCSTDEGMQQETLCRRQWTDEYRTPVLFQATRNFRTTLCLKMDTLRIVI